MEVELPEEISPLAEPLVATCELLARCGQSGMIIGGVALALVARPRQTNDVDATIWCPDDSFIDGLLKLAKQLGLEPRRRDAAAFARASRVILLQHVRTKIGVDVSLAEIPFEKSALGRKQRSQAGPLAIPHCSAEDLIVMKLIAHRDQDLLDAANTVRYAKRLDRRRVLRWVRELAKILETPDLVEEAERLLRGRPR